MQALLTAETTRRFDTERAAGRYDALVMPSALGAAPDRSTTGDAAFNGPWTGLGVPTVSVPTGLAADGLPAGTQLIWAPLEEVRLLGAARWVEAAVGFAGAPRPESTLRGCSRQRWRQSALPRPQ